MATITLLKKILCAATVFAMVGSPGATLQQTPVEALNSYAHIDPGIVDSRVTVATNGEGTAVSLWLVNASGDGDLPAVYTSTSTDAGQSWSSRTRIFQLEDKYKTLIAASAVHLKNDTWLMICLTHDAEPGHRQVLHVAKSADNAQTWSAPEVAFTGVIYDDWPSYFETSVATDGAGAVAASFDFGILRSGDFGNTWTFTPTPGETDYPATPIITNLKSRIGYLQNGRWINVFLRNEEGSEPWKKSLYIMRSGDNGVTWSDPQNLVDGNDYHNMQLGDVATDGHIAIIAYQDDGIQVLRSGDGGASWPAVGPFPEIATHIDPASELSIALDEGKAVMAWDARTIHSADLIQVCSSSNAGQSWGQVLSASPGPGDMTPSLASVASGQFILQYETLSRPVGYYVLRQIKSLRSIDGGTTFRDLLELNVGASGQLDLHQELYPHGAAGDDGTRVVAWNAVSPFGATVIGHIAVAVSRDKGLSWGNALPLHPSYSTDGYSSISPKVAYNGEGRWFAYWSERSRTQTLGSVSTDNAVSWSQPTVLPPGGVLDVLATDRRGTMLARTESDDWRSYDSGVTWSPSGVSYGHAVVHLFEDRWLKLEGVDSYLSTDNAHTWSLVGKAVEDSTNPVNGAVMARSSDGTITAAIRLSETCMGSFCTGPLRIVRSTDDGASWDPGIIATSTGTPPTASSFATLQIGSLDSNYWLVLFEDLLEYGEPAYITSADDGANWSQLVVPREIMYGSDPVLIAADSRATIMASVVGYTLPSRDYDIQYLSLLSPAATAAADWQLFE